jgi:hypothetical protein
MAKRKKVKAGDNMESRIHTRSLRERSRRYSSGMHWARSKVGEPLVIMYASALYEYGFSEREINEMLPALIYNTFLFIKY